MRRSRQKVLVLRESTNERKAKRWVETIFQGKEFFLGAFVPVLGSVVGSVSGYLSPPLFGSYEKEDVQKKERIDRALQFASGKFERLEFLKGQGELSHDEFCTEVEGLFKHTQKTFLKLTSVL